MSGARQMASAISLRDVSPPNLAAPFGTPPFCFTVTAGRSLGSNEDGSGFARADVGSRGGQRARSDRRGAANVSAPRIHDDATWLSHPWLDEPSGDPWNRVPGVDR